MMEMNVVNLHDRRADHRWDRMVVGDMFERLRWSTPDKPALVGVDGAWATPGFDRLTYAQADDAANRVAQALRGAGLRETDRVLLYCENSIEAVITMFGIAKAGMVAVPVNPNLADDVFAWVIATLDIKFVIVDGSFGTRAAALLADGDSGLSVNVTIPIEGPVADGSLAFGAWIADQPADEVDGRRHADEVWSILFTSGTTSMPKAAMSTHTYSHMTGFAYAMSLTRGLNFERNLVTCTFLPILYHCGHNATIVPTILAGGTTVLGRRPNPAALAKAVSDERVTAVWAGSPTWAHELARQGLEDPELDLTSLTVVMFSWGAMNAAMVGDLKTVCGPQVQTLEVFGQTEAMSCYRFWPDEHPDKFAESIKGTNYVGLPNPLLAADVVDAEGNSLRGQPGVPGEAVYRGPVVSVGYFLNEEETAAAYRDGWFHSGDSCMYDEDGQQIMVDRYKDIVKSGGENVSSVRVEGVLMAHPSIERAAVVGLPDERWGERVTAVVVAAAGTQVDPDEVIAFARERLARHEAPKDVVVVEDLPVTVGGKIMKYRLREQLTQP